MGVTAQEAAISAMVNWRASYMRRAFPISSGVILGFRPPLRAAGAGGGEPGLSAFTDEGGLVRGHQGEHPEHEGAVRGGGVDQSVAQRPDPDPAGLQGGDDVDEVAQVAAKPVDPPDDQGVARALSLCLVVIGVRVAQRAQARAWGQHREAVAAQLIEVGVPERGQADHVVLADRITALAEFVYGGVEIAGVPQRGGVEHDAQRPQLVFLALSVALIQRARSWSLLCILPTGELWLVSVCGSKRGVTRRPIDQGQQHVALGVTVREVVAGDLLWRTTREVQRAATEVTLAAVLVPLFGDVLIQERERFNAAARVALPEEGTAVAFALTRVLANGDRPVRLRDHQIGRDRPPVAVGGDVAVGRRLQLSLPQAL